MAALIGYGSNLHQCDNCRKIVDNWNIYGLVKRHYEPGKNHDKCSSDIKMYQNKIVELCYDCMEELESLYKEIEKHE